MNMAKALPTARPLKYAWPAITGKNTRTFLLHWWQRKARSTARSWLARGEKTRKGLVSFSSSCTTDRRALTASRSRAASQIGKSAFSLPA